MRGDLHTEVNRTSRNVQYVTDANGERTAVILPPTNTKRLEDLHVDRVAEETKDEPRRPFNEVLEELRNAGEIDE